MWALINDNHLFYTEEGPANGLPVVFLHGFPFNHTMWLEQLRAINGFCRAVAYDVKGHGMSDVGDGQYSVEAHADDLLALLDALHIEKTVIAGLSMGGYIALRALEKNPERFLAAVLCDTRSEADTDKAREGRFAGIRTVKREGSAVFADNFVKAIFSEASFSKKPDAVRRIHRMIEATPPLSIAGTLLALASRTDTTASLDHIQVPTLILVGENDAVTPVEAARKMHERIRGSELHVIPGAGHMSNLENPEAFNDRLIPFLRRVAGGGPGESRIREGT
jgi:3-oxoadipate enol-lactonase